ncbi:MAG: FtsX-like permease family protein, partial [Microbacterium sp.]
AIAAGLGPSIAGVDITVALDSVEAVGAEPLDLAGSATLGGGGDLDAVVWLADGGVLAEADTESDADAPSVRAVVTEALASRLGIGVGDPVEFRYAGTGRQGAATVSSVVDAVPGAATSLALFVPMETLLTSQLQRGTSIVPPNAVWATGELGAADELSATLGDRPVTTAAPGVAADVVGALVGGWWIATIGSIALSLVAAFGIVQTLAIARRRELGVLRALGVTPASQARMRAGELGGVFAAALVLGGAAGVLVSWLVVPALVRAVTPGILPLATGLSFSWIPLAVALAVLAAGLAVVISVSAASTHRAARGATVGEEAR